ncbi:PTS sugar transporter subunit IIB [Collinsella sp. An2]|uniref:PTS sugar transporter subunit IIB n=1 Tax=Collinsella sp. An2 TaxID=1965585 RepID=UPI000B36C1F1|nr:PTS sugar transporter subunit IIB [Collinsella sp. An2]OUP08902.1 PTS mannose/fructose/sorbose transporter subunit IIB [Collinsella sp. An2]
MIKLMRVDYRLIHGQVAMAWTHTIGADCILVAGDAIAADDMRKATLRLARPSGVKLVIKDIDNAIAALKSGVTEKYSLFIIVESIEDAYRLAMGYDGITSINLGGTRSTDDTNHRLDTAIFATDHDIEMLRELSQKGVEIEIRQVPTDDKVDASKLL